MLLMLGLKNSRPFAAIGLVQARGANPRLCWDKVVCARLIERLNDNEMFVHLLAARTLIALGSESFSSSSKPSGSGHRAYLTMVSSVQYTPTPMRVLQVAWCSFPSLSRYRTL